MSDDPNNTKPSKGDENKAPTNKRSRRPAQLKPQPPAQPPPAVEAKPQPPKPPKKIKTAKVGGGRPDKYNWDKIRLAYIKGGDDVTYLALSGISGNPSEIVIRRRAAQENWTTLRKQFRHEVVALTQQLEVKLAAIPKAAALNEVRERQAAGAIRLQQISLELIEEIAAETEIDPVLGEIRGKRWRESGLGTGRMLYQTGTEIERKARGMEEYTVNLNEINSPADLKRLSTSQILELLQRRQKAVGADAAAYDLDIEGGEE